MAAHATLSRQQRSRGSAGNFLMLPFALFVVPVLAAAGFVAYVLWPSWPSAPLAPDAPPLPITVADELVLVPPAAIRAAVQRHPGPHERIDLVFLWPSLTPPPADGNAQGPRLDAVDGGNAAPSPKAEAADADGRLFVSIVPLGALLAPAERLRSIYPRYVEPHATTGGDGLTVVSFRAGTPYEGEDLIYVADNAGSADRFYARCTRPLGIVPGTCIHERMLGGADMTLRFPRSWLEKDWRGLAAGFDRLIARLHPDIR
jgi:hypothetical protein